MRHRIWIYFVLAVASTNAGTSAQEAPTRLAERVDSLLGRMTIEEKVGQLQQVSADLPLGSSRDAVLDMVRRGKVGSIFDLHGAKRVNAIQRIAVTESRLKIPIVFGFDVIHGYRTILPVPLAMASSWDPAVEREAAAIGAGEARAAGVRWTFAPMIDVARDPRWGRMVEGAGEDPFLGSAMARAQIQGFQGESLSAPARVAACAKHWVAYGAVEGGREYNGAPVSERALRTIYFPPFLAAREAGVATFMSALNTVDGVPASANPFTLKTVLRSEWDFRGLVVADFEAVQQLIAHGLASNPTEAARLAINAGVDMEEKSTLFTEQLVGLVARGEVEMSRLDEAVRRVLRLKFEMGLFDQPFADEATEADHLLTEADRASARKLASRSMVLLRNEGDLLPIKPSTRSIAVIGPFADDRINLLGPWHGAGRDTDVTTILTGVQNLAREQGGSTTVATAEGCKPDQQADSIDQAVALARSVELVVVVVGEPWTMSGEATSRSDLKLPGRQLDLVRAIRATNTPIVVVLINGRPLAVDWEELKIPAVLEAWFPGVAGGPAIADILFGRVNPGGKLPVTFPRSVGEVPWYYNHRSTGRPASATDKYTSKYIDQPLTPLYPFGYGLSYTRFEMSPPTLSASTINPDGRVVASVSVRNVGNRGGDEVVQLYVRDVAASVTRPIRELRGFERVTLQPGESQTVRFSLGPRELGFYNQEMRFVVEPGEFQVESGSSSDQVRTTTFRVVGAVQTLTPDQ